MPSRLDDLLDAALVLGAVGLHVAAASWADAFPPTRTSEWVVVGVPLVVQLVAAGLLVVRRDRRAVQAACLLEWLLVLFTLPSAFVGLAFVPSAAVLSVALARPRRLSSDRPGSG